jgi:hypothetical protein
MVASGVDRAGPPVCHGGVMTNKDEQSEGQVSEVGSMDPADADTAISDSQGVAGNPDSPTPDEIGEAGPNANPHSDEDTH